MKELQLGVAMKFLKIGFEMQTKQSVN